MTPDFDVPNNGVMDPTPNKPQPCCIVCGTWVCRGCWGFSRPYARFGESDRQICNRCGSTEGFFRATRHTHWKANKPFFLNGYRHRVMPQIPFEVPKMSISNPWACPAGDPCPGTGCHACCPSYDPCGKAGCNSCKVETVHVPEEADAMIEPEPEECDWVVRMATLETPDEYCGLEVQAGNEFCPKHQAQADALVEEDPSPATKLQNIIEGIRNAASRYVVEENPTMIADAALKAGLPVSQERQGADRRYARQNAMEWAVSLMRPTVTPDTLMSQTASTTVQLAQRLYEWLIEE